MPKFGRILLSAEGPVAPSNDSLEFSTQRWKYKDKDGILITKKDDKEMITDKTSIARRLAAVLLGAAIPACIGFASVSEDRPYAAPGEGEGSSSTDEDGTDFGHDTSSSGAVEDCMDIPWGSSCQEGSRTYNVTFTGIVTSTGEEMEISLADIHCDGYSSALLFAGDTSCPTCPLWVEELGNYADDFQDRNAALIASYTEGLGRSSLTNQEAELETEDASPNYVTGSDPYQYPCRYAFTPFLMIVDLDTAEILYRQEETDGFPIEDILNLLEEADN